MTKIPEFLRSHLAFRQSRSGEHPSTGLLAEFVEQTLPARERADLLEHLARCPECRDVLAAASIPDISKAPRVAWWKWRWAAAATACVVATLFWLPGSFRNSSRNATPLAPAAPSAPKEEEPKAAEAKRSEVTKKRIARIRIDPQPEAAEQPSAEAELPAPAPQLAIAQPEKLERPNMTFQSDLRTSVAKALARGTFRPQRGNSRWNLDGALRKSDDGGKTWRTVPVDDRARLFALSAAGSNVWVGGANGTLFHSVDDGLEWKPVAIADDNGRLTETITRIEARDENWVKLTTRSGDWLTTDAGAHWRRE